MTQEILIKVNNVGMERNHKRILDNISFDISRGDFFAITGPNGGGKTSLMRIILG